MLRHDEVSDFRGTPHTILCAMPGKGESASAAASSKASGTPGGPMKSMKVHGSIGRSLRGDMEDGYINVKARNATRTGVYERETPSTKRLHSNLQDPERGEEKSCCSPLT